MGQKWGFRGGSLCQRSSVCPQEMLEIMKSIYDMMGRCTLPAPRDSAPAEHVEQFFQVSLHHTVGMGMGGRTP